MKLNRFTVFLAFVVTSIIAQIGYSKELLIEKQKPEIISPKKGDVWHEEQTYTIRWKGFKEGIICIAVLIGGHYAGTINSCSNCALEGKFRWKIPKGFVTGFGEKKDDFVRIVIYYKDNESNCTYSNYFTISQ